MLLILESEENYKSHETIRDTVVQQKEPYGIRPFKLEFKVCHSVCYLII